MSCYLSRERADQCQARAGASYREVANSDRVLQQPLEADGPAGHPPLRVAPVALHAGQAGIAVQTVVAAAALQLHAVQLCWENTHTHELSRLWAQSYFKDL